MVEIVLFFESVLHQFKTPGKRSMNAMATEGHPSHSWLSHGPRLQSIPKTVSCLARGKPLGDQNASKRKKCPQHQVLYGWVREGLADESSNIPTVSLVLLGGYTFVVGVGVAMAGRQTNKVVLAMKVASRPSLDTSGILHVGSGLHIPCPTLPAYSPISDTHIPAPHF